MDSRFTKASQEVLRYAHESAREISHAFVGSEHIILGILKEGESKASEAISSFDITKDRLRALSYIGYVPELSVLYGDMFVYDFLEWIANIWQIKDTKNAIIEASKQMKILNVLNERIENLSKGYKKRVADL